MSSTSQQVDEQAAQWAVLRDLGLTPAQQEAFEQWLKADTRHLGAYARAEGSMIRVERASAAVRGRAALAPLQNVKLTRRRVILAGSVAASVVAAVFTGRKILERGGDQILVTGKGEVREVLLSDGSVVRLNTDSKVAVQYTDEMRKLHLLKGEAHFDVAKNKSWPFVVQANDMLVRAVGTSFMVSVLPQKPVQVLVKEGVVEIKRASAAAVSPVRVSANNQAIAPHGSEAIVATPVAEAKLARNLAWEYGYLAFDDQTLQEAAAEYARYSDIQIVIDPAVAKMTITGSFVANDPVGFARSAASALDLQVDVSGRKVKIYR